MTTPDVKQVVDSLREHRERLIIRGEYGHGWTDVSDATNLEQAALLISSLTTEANELRAKVEGLERDRVRLDWMLKTGGYRYTVAQIDGYYVAEIFSGFPIRLTPDLYPTARAAIDAAMGDANG